MNDDLDVSNDDAGDKALNEAKKDTEVKDGVEGGVGVDSNKVFFYSKNNDSVKSGNATTSYDKSENSGRSGVMSNNVGTGKHAKTNIIWYIVSGSFVVFSCISVALFVLVVYGYAISDLTQAIKDIWGIFTPILTLSLGYLFGKQGRSREKGDREKINQ